MVGLVNEKSLAEKVLGQVRAREAVRGRVGTSKSVVERSRLAEVEVLPENFFENRTSRPSRGHIYTATVRGIPC
jgi:hypothetical protein